jgi:hypothetical protein
MIEGGRMRSSRILSAIAVLLLASVCGCSQRIGDFTVISTKNVEIGGKFKKLDARFKGEDSKGMFLGIPLGVPSLKTAVDNCIEAGKGDLLTNAVLDMSFWTVIIWGEQKYTATGDVWMKAGMSDLRDGATDLSELRADALGYELVSVQEPSRVVRVDYLASR